LKKERTYGVGLFFVSIGVLIMLFATHFMGWKLPCGPAVVSISVGSLSFLIGIYIILKLEWGAK